MGLGRFSILIVLYFVNVKSLLGMEVYVQLSVIFDKIKHLFPGYFALVMATGALSIATYLLDYDKWSNYLFYLNTLFIITLAIVVTIRFLFFLFICEGRFNKSLKRAWFFLRLLQVLMFMQQSFFFFVNKTNLALILWLISIILWTAIMYTFFYSHYDSRG